MNEDLLTRLRRYDDQLGGITGEALGEIERLNETVMLERGLSHQRFKKIESLSKENAKQREALEMIAACSVCSDSRHCAEDALKGGE